MDWLEGAVWALGVLFVLAQVAVDVQVLRRLTELERRGRE